MKDIWLGKRYHSLNAFFRNRFGEKVYRVSVDAGFTCPNRDGTKAAGGCMFCGEDGARASYVNPELPVEEQILNGIDGISKRTHAKKFLAYFQAYSNTYADVNTLEKTFRKSLSIPGIIGLSIGTRPDCIDAQKLSMLENLAEDTHVLIEYGAQTMNEESLLKMNRGHTVKETETAILETKKRKNISVLAHLIFGLPGETPPDAIDSVKKLVALGVDAFKFHHLFVEKGTVLEKAYQSGNYKPLEREEYFETICSILPILPPEVVIHRFFGQSSPDKLLAPEWTLHKTENLRLLEALLEKRNIRQGSTLADSFKKW